MKILKLPFDTTIKCDCGCEFEFGLEDVKERKGHFSYASPNSIVTEKYVQCPICGEYHELLEFF